MRKDIEQITKRGRPYYVGRLLGVNDAVLQRAHNVRDNEAQANDAAEKPASSKPAAGGQDAARKKLLEGL